MKPLVQETDDIIAGYYANHKPFLLIDNTKEFEGSNRTSMNEEDDLKYIRFRKDGRYEYRRQFDGVKYHEIGKKEKVKKYAVWVNSQIKNSMAKEKIDRNVTFYDYAIDFYNLYKVKKIEDSAKEEYNTAHNKFKEHFNKPFRLLKAKDFQSFINEEAEEHPTSAKKLYYKIKAVCKKAFLEGVIETNIGEIIEKPEVEENTRRALTLKEQIAFLQEIESMPHDFKVYCLFCLITSARREEAVKLRPEHYNAEDGTLFINGTKTLNAPRTIRVTADFVELLKSINFRFKYSGDYYSRNAKVIFEKIGGDDLVLNSLRHTCATNMVYLGISSEYRKHIMGHSTIVITDRVYTHIDMRVKKEDILKLYGNLYFRDF